MEIACVLVFVVAFALSWGPVTWIYLSEIMAPKAMALGALANMTCLNLVALGTEPLLNVLEGGLFIMFGALCLIMSAFVFFIVKETKGKSEVEVAQLYIKRKTYAFLP